MDAKEYNRLKDSFSNYGQVGLEFGQQLAEAYRKLSNAELKLRDQFAMNAPITFLDAAIQCGYSTPLTEAERAAVMSVLALMRYEYADAMIKQKEVK